MKFYTTLLLIFIPFWMIAQIYDDHIGAGQQVGVIVSSSNEGDGNQRNLALDKRASQSSDYSANNFFASYANDGNLNTMNHTTDPSNLTDAYLTENIRNLALYQTASQSSNFSANVFLASYANDGDISTMNHTLDSLYSWWEVDLGEIGYIASIEVFNRTTCCSNRLNNFYIFVSDTPFTSDDPNTTAGQPDVANYFTATALDANTFDVNRTGRYVRVQLAGQEALHVTEVEVWGISKVKQWWEVDLGTISDITNIEVLNRTNCCSDRLDNSYVFVSDTPFTSEDVNETINQANVSNYFIATAQDTNTIAANRTGRYVRVQLSEENALHMREVRVFGTAKANAALNTINGTGTLPNLADASRFLSQATLGYNYEEVERVSSMGVDAWLEDQFNLPTLSYLEKFQSIYDEIRILAPESLERGKNQYLSYCFYEMILKEPDFLRHKVAFALSQILVASYLTDANDKRGFGASAYYDILYQNAFGNYSDILQEASANTYMGKYLTFYQNSKADFGQGTFPDENYAREIMQLFSIGLVELNNDGTPKLDADGNTIPTYDIKDIHELSRVFTGFASNTHSFTSDHRQTNYAEPMNMFEGYHDTDEKEMIDGTILPAGQTGAEDVHDAVNMLFNHPNVGPFISIRLIQQLVKSNPSPAYINRVANTFNNNGQGIRGDMEAVVKAILTDPEARTCAYDQDSKAGKLLQPIERFTKLLLAFDVSTPTGRMWLEDKKEFGDELEQSVMGAPSVFNYFSPFYAESEYVAPNDMVSPEFQILHSTTGIHYLNLIEGAIKENNPFDNRTTPTEEQNGFVPTGNDAPILDLSDEVHIMDSQGLSALLDRLDILLCRGQLSVHTRTVIQDIIQQYQAGIEGYSAANAVKDAIYLIMVSPNFMILK